MTDPATGGAVCELSGRRSVILWQMTFPIYESEDGVVKGSRGLNRMTLGGYPVDISGCMLQCNL